MAVGVAEVARGADWRSRTTRMDVRELILAPTPGEVEVAVEVDHGDSDLGWV